MSQRLGTLDIGSARGVASARQKVLRVAERLGLDRQGQTRLATAVSEIARNALAYAGRGTVEVALDATPPPGRLVVTIIDRGSGIADLDAVLGGQKPAVAATAATSPPAASAAWAASAGRGAGLAGARRLVDQFEIETGPAGTTVRLAQHLPRQARPRAPEASLADIAQVLSDAGTDPLAVLREQDRQLIDSLTELQARQLEADRLSRELDETNRGVVALYSELDQKADQLRVASDLKSRFLSHMSHEFRTPLNSILALTRLLLDRVDGELSGEQQRQIEYVRKAAQGLLELVNDLLDLAKVEAGKLDIRPRDFEVEELFAGLRGSLRPLLVNPEVELGFEGAEGLPRLYADEQKLAQVLRNLVSNALKFTERGHVRVRARHDAARGRVVFAVEDTGIGIAPADQGRLFEEFSQIDGRLQRGGTGLGLALSRRLALLMGGDLGVQSEPGRGSTFEFFVPVRFGQTAPAATPDAAGGADGAPRLLVVDDEEAFRYVVSHIAADAGFRIAEAANGEEALANMLERRPDLVVLDLHMPVMDGFTVLSRMDSPALSGVPVVVCTSQVLQVEQKRMLSRAHAIVSKHDISRDGLSRLLRSAIGVADPEGGSPA